MSKKFKMKIVNNIPKITKKLKDILYITIVNELENFAYNLVDYITEGSMKESRTPPIRTGYLIASCSTFFNGALVRSNHNFKPIYSEPRLFNPPVIPYINTEIKNGITIYFSAHYAYSREIGRYKLGKISKLQINAGNNFLRRHLAKDVPAFITYLKEIVKEELNAISA